ncbi:MAG: 50S ribosomal protein L23 [Planctomycetota bacterium]|nr:50S ribosomal protein L23 [Planctomycetota bacterium]MDI6788222.1 50S ribosomal protein L23 [Planctomycetota bacterium]
MKKSPYDVIIKPLLTEKTESGKQKRVYSFMVDKSATKDLIKNAVESIFPDAKVDSVRTLNVKGKVKKHKFISGTRKTWKKAMVVLKEGYRIEV